MWQHLINFILGLAMVLVALIALGMSAISTVFAWTLGTAGFAVAVLAVWGLTDEMSHLPRLDHGVESDF
jgi:hypothetical protein